MHGVGRGRRRVASRPRARCLSQGPVPLGEEVHCQKHLESRTPRADTPGGEGDSLTTFFRDNERQANERERALANDRQGIETPFQPILELQGQVGNANLGRMIASLQRQDAEVEEAPAGAREGAEADVESPGLPADVAQTIRDHLAARRRQAALDALVAYLGEDGQIDTTLLRGGRMYYSTAVAGEGEASPPGFTTDPDTGERVARLTRVRMGRAAFNRGLPWLYSSVIHEYKHVEQFQRTHREGGPLSGQGSQQWLIERQEVEAYCHEIINSRTTGMFENPRQMRETWRRLHSEHWINVGPQGKKALNDLYIQAHDIAQEAVGPDVRLPFRPLPREEAGAAEPAAAE
jgi:hypothetical protein